MAEVQQREITYPVAQIKYQTPRRVYDIASSLLWHKTKIIIILTERGDHCVGDC